MTSVASPKKTCVICKKSFLPKDIVSGELIRKEIAAEIIKSYPSWSTENFICKNDLAEFRENYLHFLLESESGELSSLAQDVVRSLKEHELLSFDIESKFDQKWTFGERMADKIAVFGGSWAFLISFALFLLIWIGVNSFMFISHPIDPYPFIFLNLILSCIAAVQAPFIMMSQNRQEAKDRIRSQHDYQINLKAELEIRHLHEKVDHLLSNQWNRLVQIQELQLELLSELNAKK
ncbi:MAG: hypothetical protein A3K14_07105 [Sulfurimonas sp. RIFCSPLOWO2_12_FULL_36_74]|uniref:DUF1003 domain-containing protein n=1 Tax=Sulfurimonas sp. RIFCSPLOWO2_12_36_12 TaxID=1802253 RepID=UPI0008BBAFB0|nr:DUF1003 domain-containing protein [Sulfurimonas sp. RIFCSPLOWO2_12_36_12]OHD99850.1 MAG: hypothetical protein A3J26_07065 [Sulfurimonas sp. RIFCSPLOWO2_02_FULL_36_28]OHE02386.1 MAG: hypothetical protein A2W82_09830 [Sulfurimonas sp. RIFCSPLOWO2_12_36_12]OHE02655.1 MAG: hypothetical protein A3K14_07105 [Sulfurimonas sp. RIFCSPLOWO2_12_FULL_36_74]